MEPTLSVSQLRVLAEGIANKGVLSLSFVYNLYSSDEAAKSCILTLESWGYITQIKGAHGYFAVVKAPDDAHIIADNMKKAKEKLENKQNIPKR